MDHHLLLASIAAAGNSSNNKRRNGNANDPPLRQGKWTREEEVRYRDVSSNVYLIISLKSPF